MAQSNQQVRALKKQMLMEHLMALRGMLVRIALAVLICFLIIFYFALPPLIDFVLAPVHAKNVEVIATKVSESLMMQLKTALVAAVVVSMPFIMFEVWRFVSPALYQNEKKTFLLVFFSVVLLFFVGVAFSYVVVFPLAVNLFYEAGAGVALPMWSVEEYFHFTLAFVLPFGLMFELPAACFMLARRGLVTGRGMAEKRRFFILAAAVAAAILTPPDVVSQMMLLAPMLILYEISVIIAKRVKPKEAVEVIEEPEEDETEAADQ